MNDKHIQTITGTVVQRSGDKTVRVTAKSTKTHPIYKKRYTVSRHYLAHDESNAIAVGDVVVIAPCRPISRRKTWQIVRKIDA